MPHILIPKYAHDFGFNLAPRLVQVMCIDSKCKRVRTRSGNVMRRCALVAAHRGASPSYFAIALRAPRPLGRSCIRSSPLLGVSSYKHR